MKKLSPAPPHGIALVAVLVILAFLAGLGVVAIYRTDLGSKLASTRKTKLTTDLLARKALEILQLRIQQRMNPPVLGPDSQEWAWNGQLGKDPRALVLANGDPNCGSTWKLFKAGGNCFHGYRFQQGWGIATSQRLYVENFLWEGDPARRVGVFEPCLESNGKCPRGAEWELALEPTLSSLEFYNATPGPSPIDLRRDGMTDNIRQLRVVATGIDSISGRRSVLRADLAIVSTIPAKEGVFAVQANVLSRMSLMSGMIKGVVATYLDPSLLPKDPVTGGALDPSFFDLGMAGSSHWSCNAFPVPLPCSSLSGFSDPSGQKFHTNEWILGAITNMGLSASLGAHTRSTAMPISFSSLEGITIDDQDALTGDPLGSPQDALELQIPLTLDWGQRVFGRDSYGGVSTAAALAVSEALNRSAQAKLYTVPGGACIFDTMTGFPPAGGRNTYPNQPPGLPPSGITVLALGGGCDIKVEGTFVIDGDLVIAGDGTGRFHTGADDSAGIYATGNIYILNDVNLNTGMPEERGVLPTDRDEMAFFRNLLWSPSAPGGPGHLNLLAGGNIIIGNLANSQVFSYIMTYANSEIAYYNLDLTGDGVLDFLVPDGLRPTRGAKRPTGGNYLDYQVRRSKCGDFLTSFQSPTYAKEWTCDSHASGLLPKGANLISSKRYNFAFIEPAGSGHAPGYGYVRDPTDASPAPGVAARVNFNDALYNSDPPNIGNLFSGSAMTEPIFRGFAQAPIDATHPHDSLDPNWVSRVHYIAAKMSAGNAIVGLVSFDDKYNLPSDGATLNPDSTDRPRSNFPLWTDESWSRQLLKDANNLTRYPQGCTGLPPPATLSNHADPTRYPQGLDIFGSLSAPYINIGSTNGLCIYADDRNTNQFHEPIFVFSGGARLEDPTK